MRAVTAAVGLATLAAAELFAKRCGSPLPAVRVDRAHAALAFRRERYARPLGWELPPLWDPIAGDYATRDGWIRLHTNYSHHRRAALAVLGVEPARDAVAPAVAGWPSEELEQAVLDRGGCAAAMRTLDAWRAHPQGAAVAREPVVAIERSGPAMLPASRVVRPLSGVRVLDLTRVIAGPVCTGFLAAWGADVLRLDPPGFEEVPGLLPETTAGKRRAMLDLRDPRGRDRFAELLRDAHVLVTGYRPDALPRLDLAPARLRAQHPSLLVATLDAYGFTGPWARRRGFDSLVQMSTGIAARGAEVYGPSSPHPLPAQALDHASGFLLAAGVCRALADGAAGEVRVSLARRAALLVDLGERDPSTRGPGEEDLEPWLEEVPTAWGPLRRVRLPGEIEGVASAVGPPPGPLGSDPPAWTA